MSLLNIYCLKIEFFNPFLINHFNWKRLEIFKIIFSAQKSMLPIRMYFKKSIWYYQSVHISDAFILQRTWPLLILNLHLKYIELIYLLLLNFLFKLFWTSCLNIRVVNSRSHILITTKISSLLTLLLFYFYRIFFYLMLFLLIFHLRFSYPLVVLHDVKVMRNTIFNYNFDELSFQWK